MSTNPPAIDYQHAAKSAAPGPMGEKTLLDVFHLFVSYGAIQALRGVSLQIQKGEIVALIGANGAGKSTLLRTISGLVRPTSGAIRLAAQDGTTVSLEDMRTDKIVSQGVSQVPEGRQIFANLTVRENLLLGGYQCRDAKIKADNLQRCYELFPVLAERREQNSGTLSGGEQQMLAIGRALMQRPRLLLLDEPSLGLAPLIVRRIFEHIRSVNEQGVTVFLVEQNAHMALSVAHRAYVLQTGEIVMTGSAKELADNAEVKKAYLGG
jgi:branched-chain amino acid transport system ATP-binding protein